MQMNLKNLILAGTLGASVVVTGLTGCSMDTQGRTTGRYIDDRRVSGRVKDSLEEAPVYKFPQVEVRTYRGVTQLSGFVETDEQRRQAGEIARRVPGPREVVNSIIVQPPMLPAGRTGE